MKSTLNGRLILGLMAVTSTVLAFQNCSPAKFSEVEGSLDKASEESLQVRSFYTQMEGYKADNWQLTAVNWDPVVEVWSPIEGAKYNVSLKKSSLDRSSINWNGCTMTGMKSQWMDDGFDGLKLTGCVIPVEKAALEVTVLNSSNEVIAVQKREITINQLRLHGISRSLSVDSTSLNILETRKPDFKIEYPDWDGFVRLIVRNSSNQEICRRVFETKRGQTGAHFPDVMRSPLQPGSGVREFPFARNDGNFQVVECRLVAGSYRLDATFGMDSAFTKVGSNKQFEFTVTKPVEALSHIFDDETKTWISLGQVSDNMSYNSLPAVKMFRTGQSSPYDCSVTFRVRRSAIANLPNGRIQDYSNSYRYHWARAYSGQTAPYDDPDYIYFTKSLGGCATGVFFIDPYYEINGTPGRMYFNEFWVRYK